MLYKSFRIQNFKGIQDTTVSLQGLSSPKVFAFVGLNESGKTTLLEAIHSFSPDSATSELLGGDENTGVPFKRRVPRHVVSSFTGDVSVRATLIWTDDDKEALLEAMKQHDLEIDGENLPLHIEIERHQRFKGGDFQTNYFTLRSSFQVRSKRQRKWREPDSDEKTRIRDYLYGKTPDIAYFPTFIFDFPKSVFLTSRGSEVDRFYRRVFQDILDFDGRSNTIEKDIVRRLRDERMVVDWLSFLRLWQEHDDKLKVQHVMDRASATVTDVVFGRWNRIFGEDVKGKEVVISFDVEEAEQNDSNGNQIDNHEHDIKVKFEIRDGTRRFDVNDRSLGFRWFFAFMLFTQFRVARTRTRPLLFLFDEPASNLHAAAQQKLIDCFPEIAQGEHALAYSTHSHYMIEPKWLEQTFIVTNRADATQSSILDEVSLDDESIDVQATTYRAFVNDHPNHTSFFQPILDRLEVVPARLDLQSKSVILEGKSDYYILRYESKLLKFIELPLVPGLGAGTFGALVGLNIGWNLDFTFILDADKQGQAEASRYTKDFGLSASRIHTLADLKSGVTVIEDLLDEEAKQTIKSNLGISGKLSKNAILRFCQERLASDDVIELSKGFRTNAHELLTELKARM